MNKKAIVIAVVLFVLIVAGMFVFAQLKRAELAREQAPAPTPTDTTETPSPIRVTAKHFYTDGVHTLAGEIPMPTPCDLLTAEASVGERAMVNFTTINNSEMCAQVITPQRFKVSFTAARDIQIEAMLNGTPVILNLIEAGADENPDNFELFIKG